MDILSITLTLQQILSLLIAIYICIVVGVILLDNRAPQSTFAWLFLMVAFPILGFLVYIFFGRNYKAFSNENKLARVGGLSSLYGQVIQPLRAVQDEYAEIVRREKPEVVSSKTIIPCNA